MNPRQLWSADALRRGDTEAAYLLVLNIGFELLYSEISGADINEWLRFGISIATILLCLLYVRLPFRQSLAPALNWIARGFTRVNALVDWLLEPLGALFSLLVGWVGGLFSRTTSPDHVTGD